MADPDLTRKTLVISCADSLGLMTDHLDDALSREDAERMRSHLAGCEPCSVFLGQLRATVAATREAGRAEGEYLDAQRLQSRIDLFRTQQED
jgi:anti-sigma factor RsiW